MNLSEIRRNIMYSLLRLPCIIYFWLVCGYTFRRAPAMQGPYIVLANHNMESDPVMLACAFRERLAFVAGANTMRMGILSGFIRRYFDLIFRRKGDRDSAAVLSIMRHLKNGKSVCIFPEGNRSWNGETGYIPPATAKLVRRAKVPLITFKFTGTYLTSPRWSRINRKGRIHGECVKVYTPEELSAMTDGEVHNAITDDLSENAFDRQRETAVPFKGKALAENIETGYYFCPECGAFGAVYGEGDEVVCSACGMRGKANKYGFFENMPFSDTIEWDRWQKEKLKAYVENAGEGIVFSDKSVKLITLADDPGQSSEETADIYAYADRFEIGGHTFMYDDIFSMAMHKNANITFASPAGYFELTADRVWCARKYLDLFMEIREGQHGV